MTKFLICLGVAFLISLGCSGSRTSIASASMIPAATCSQTDVQKAIDSAKGGDTVLVPAGNCTWATANANNASVYVEKAITLKGAGIDQTIITDSTNYDGNGKEVAIAVTGRAGQNMRISGFTFISATGDSKGVISLKNSNATAATVWKGARVDHCKFTINGLSIYVGPAVYGVIDNCMFDHRIVGGYYDIQVYGLGRNFNSESFRLPNPIGTDNAMYIEDCTFISAGAVAGNVDSYDGAHVVTRYCSFTNGGIQLHDTAYTGLRGSRHNEIYNNTFYTDVPVAKAVAFRSGTGVIHDNVFSGQYGNCVSLVCYRCGVPASSQGGIEDHWGYCNYGNTCDVNSSSYGNGYPCFDQIGRVTDQGSGSADACYEQALKWPGPARELGPAQPLEPLYAWNNKCYPGETLQQAQAESYDAAIIVPDFCTTFCSNSGLSCTQDSDCTKGGTCSVKRCVPDYIMSGRDYYDQTVKPGYVAYSYPHPLTYTPEDLHQTK
jgi:hypothetical protein